ncbi:MAG: cation diffusion facilitator family transporter [Lachnospiraceae bacterium]|jgi:cation diffusion facilitator family transporter|nr:cation diffusion facilitator family transporter [Lachnospiraceae bacterium]MCH4063621.1 cation diffusion facilitator family transporter [Lachnospiraceae bacterium]MCH4103656.1 cation diffusion facilitator family transporter [Lachnospiraceae bacterium]MCI1310092.1 cation diffusion facilitator family transporter [Lachnospiraceae bacterium]MCI1334544.1 cation diffusion facilitator family transporter [Lachnospiraceae bacterium]
MTEFLIRKFVKNPENVTDTSVRLGYSRLAGLTGIILNFCLFLLKLFTGIVTSSVSVIADSFNNLSDASSNIIALIGSKLASQPADKKHPFGHGRIEYISALIVAIVIIEVGFESLKSSAAKILHPESTELTAISLVILCMTVLVKLWMAVFYRKIGTRIGSQLLTATSTDARNDCIVTSVTIAVILIEHFLPVHIDGIAGLIVSAFVMISGFSIARKTIEPLIGEPENAVLAKQITDIVDNTDGIIGSHDLIMHSYGPSRTIASIHAEVPDTMSLEEAHTIVDRAERTVASSLGVLLTVHCDPVAVRDPRVAEIRAKLVDVLREIDPRITFHDFRIIDGVHHINLVFDIVVPFDYTEDRRAAVLFDIQKKMSEANQRFHCHIHIDTDYSA